MTKTARLTGLILLCGMLPLRDARGRAQPGEPPAPGTPAPAPPKAVVGKTFAVAPVTTGLQRRLLGGTALSRVVVLVDGSALFRDGRAVDLNALELDDIRAALVGYAPEKGRSVAHPCFHYDPDVPIPKKGPELLELALDGVIRRAGFVPAVTQTTYHAAAFRLADYAAPLRSPAGADASETAVGDERVKAYPVRTPLSRVLTGSAAGVLDVRTRIDPRAGAAIPVGVDESARAALRGLRLPPGGQVNALFVLSNLEERGNDRLRRLIRGWTEDEGLTPGTITSH